MNVPVGSLTTTQIEDLQKRIEQFRQDWSLAASIDLIRYLPPPQASHRRATLLELIRVEGQLRAEAGLHPEGLHTFRPGSAGMSSMLKQFMNWPGNTRWRRRHSASCRKPNKPFYSGF